MRQQPGIVDDPRVASLRFDDFLELAGGLATGDRDFHATTRLVAVGHGATQQQHLRAQRVGNLHQIGWTLAAKRHDGFFHFEGIPAGASQRTVHGGEQRDHRAAMIGAQVDHGFGQRESVFEIGQKGARSPFDVEDQSIQSFRQLFRHDACADQRNTLHRGRGVTQRIQTTIGGGDLTGLPNQRASQPLQQPGRFRQRQVGPKSGDRFQLVERTTSVTQSPAGHHRYRNAQRGHQRREHQRHLVPHAAGRMLVHARYGEMREVERGAALQHSVGERTKLGAVESLEVNSHRQRRHLVVGHNAIGVVLHESAPFGGGNSAPVALPFDQRACEHGVCMLQPTYCAPPLRARSASGASDAIRPRFP